MVYKAKKSGLSGWRFFRSDARDMIGGWRSQGKGDHKRHPLVRLYSLIRGLEV